MYISASRKLTVLTIKRFAEIVKSETQLHIDSVIGLLNHFPYQIVTL